MEHSHTGRLAFAKKAGISDDALSAYEEGDQEPGAWALTRIAQIAGVSVDYLLRGESAPATLSPAEHIKAALRIMRRMMEEAKLPREAERRYRDILFFTGVQMRRLVFDAERFLMELRARATRAHFDAEEFRREWLAAEDEEEDDVP